MTEMPASAAPADWRRHLPPGVRPYAERAPICALLLGISSGFPFAMIGATLTSRLADADIDKKTITAFALTFLAYNLKWSWAPLVDKQQLPFMKRVGQRRSWLILSGLLVILAVTFLGQADPSASIQLVIVAAIAVAVAGATYDIVIDSYRIELLSPAQLGVGSGMSQYGWRLGSAAAGALALVLAHRFGWNIAFAVCALFALPAIGVAIVVGEPPNRVEREWPRFMAAAPYALFIATMPIVAGACFLIDAWLDSTILVTMAAFGYLFPSFDLTARRARDAGHFGNLTWFLLIPGINLALVLWLCFARSSGQHKIESKSVDAAVGPLAQFMRRDGGWLIFLFILIHKLGDTIANLSFRLLFKDLGFTLDEIAFYDVGFGLVALLVGVFVGGILYTRLGLKRSVLVSLVLMAVSNLSFAALAQAGHSNIGMAAAIGFENFSSGIGGVAVVAYLSALCDLRFTATQFALLSAAASVLGRFVSGTTAGAMIEALGYVQFYLLTTVAALPGIVLFVVMMRRGLVDDVAIAARNTAR